MQPTIGSFVENILFLVEECLYVEADLFED